MTGVTPEIANKDNVVSFTGKWKGAKKPPNTPEEMKNGIKGVAEHYVSELSSLIATNCFQAMKAASIDVANQPSLTRDVVLVQESIKSLMLAAYGQPHKLQDIAQAFYKDVKVVRGKKPKTDEPGPIIA